MIIARISACFYKFPNKEALRERLSTLCANSSDVLSMKLGDSRNMLQYESSFKVTLVEENGVRAPGYENEEITPWKD